MSIFKETDKVILAGYGFDAGGPHLVLNTLNEERQYRFPVANQTFSLKCLPQRYCVGRFDLKTFQTQTCPMKVELIGDSKDTSCPACLEATGFNPSFYFSSNVSPQQRAYNETPHFVYMVYFSPNHVKVGISSESRGIERLLEQGARAALILGRFENADKARELESELCAQEGIYETMRASKKEELFREFPFDINQACEVLHQQALDRNLNPIQISEMVPGYEGDVLNLQPYYFVESPQTGRIQAAGEGYEDICGGLCVGMIGSNLVFKQDSLYFVAPIKSWISHIVELHTGEIIKPYDAEPTQMALL